VIVSFETEQLRDCCANLGAAEKLLGSTLAQALVNLIAEAEAFDSADELIDFYECDIHFEDDDSFCVPIGSGSEVSFSPAGVRFKRDSSGKPLWATVHRLKLVRLST
jgi:hypothetical protein